MLSAVCRDKLTARLFFPLANVREGSGFVLEKNMQVCTIEISTTFPAKQQLIHSSCPFETKTTFMIFSLQFKVFISKNNPFVVFWCNFVSSSLIATSLASFQSPNSGIFNQIVTKNDNYSLFILWKLQFAPLSKYYCDLHSSKFPSFYLRFCSVFKMFMLASSQSSQSSLRRLIEAWQHNISSWVIRNSLKN